MISSAPDSTVRRSTPSYLPVGTGTPLGFAHQLAFYPYFLGRSRSFWADVTVRFRNSSNLVGRTMLHPATLAAPMGAITKQVKQAGTVADP